MSSIVTDGLGNGFRMRPGWPVIKQRKRLAPGRRPCLPGVTQFLGRGALAWQVLLYPKGDEEAKMLAKAGNGNCDVRVVRLSHRAPKRASKIQATTISLLRKAGSKPFSFSASQGCFFFFVLRNNTALSLTPGVRSIASSLVLQSLFADLFCPKLGPTIGNCPFLRPFPGNAERCGKCDSEHRLHANRQLSHPGRCFFHRSPQLSDVKYVTSKLFRSLYSVLDNALTFSQCECLDIGFRESYKPQLWRRRSWPTDPASA